MKDTDTVAKAGASDAGTWTLGDRSVNRIGFGAMRLTGSAAFDLGEPGDRDTPVRVLRRAVELGVHHIDTASFYFSRLRSANELINTALAPYPEDLVIVTKVGPGRDPSGDWYTATPEQLRGQVEENLRQLGRDHLDVVNLRRMSQDSISEHFGALADLRDAGLIRHLGVSDVRAEHVAEARAIAPVVCVQNQYSLDVRGSGELLTYCGEQGIAFVPFFAIAGEGRDEGAGAGGGGARGYGPSPRPTGCPRPRSAWPGRCTRAGTSWRSRGPATPPTWRRTWRPGRFVSPERTWSCWASPSASPDASHGPLDQLDERRTACGERDSVVPLAQLFRSGLTPLDPGRAPEVRHGVLDVLDGEAHVRGGSHPSMIERAVTADQ